MAAETQSWTMAAETFGREAAAAVAAAAAPASVESPRSRWLGRAPADQSPVPAARQWLAVSSRGCHGYIPEDYICALYPYPLRIRAGDAYPNCIMRKGGEDISILSDRNCEIISDPYPRYGSQDTGIYMFLRLPASGEFCLNAVDLSFRVPTIGGLMSEHLAATSGDPA